MKEIKMFYQGKPLTFQVIDKGNEGKGDYYFCECEMNPAARGFFTQAYINDNEIK